MAQSSCSIYVQSSCFPKLVVNRVSFINALPDKSVIFSSRKANFMCFATSAKEEGADTSTSKRGRLRGAKMIGCGSAIPRRVLTNDDLSTFLETSHEWISSRTGICERRVLSDGETITSLATEASRKALEMANVDPQNVDAIWLCTSTPDDLFGSAAQLQAALGCSNCFAFDLTAACSGFVVGLVTAAQFLKAGAKKNILVVGADALSRHVDWTDRGTCILFGDAAGAMLLQACDEEEDGLLGFDIRSDGNGLRHLNASSTDGGDGRTEGDRAVEVPHRASYKCIEMNGKEVFRFAVRAVPQVLEGALDVANLKVEDMDWLLLHQANQRILDAVAERLKVPRKKVISNLAKYGNTSAASIPLALDEAVRSGKINGGDLIAAAGFGAGLTWASAIFKWGA